MLDWKDFKRKVHFKVDSSERAGETTLPDPELLVHDWSSFARKGIHRYPGARLRSASRWEGWFTPAPTNAFKMS
jgi:hypothetical protein